MLGWVGRVVSIGEEERGGGRGMGWVEENEENEGSGDSLNYDRLRKGKEARWRWFMGIDGGMNKIGRGREGW